MRLDATILQVIPRLEQGGAEWVVLELSRAVMRAGGRSLVASFGGRLEPELINHGAEPVRLPVHSKNPLQMIANIRRLRALIREKGVDLLHAHSRAPAWSAMLAARSETKPFITYYHGAYKSGGPLKRLYNSSMVRGDVVIANSAFTADAIAAAYPTRRGRLRIIPPGADLDRFDPGALADERIDRLAAAWGLQEAPGLRILMPARLTDWKGHHVALDAAVLLRALISSGQIPPLTLVFCGGADGQLSYEAGLRERIVELGVDDMVHMVGDCADMTAAYGWSDVVLSAATRPEAFGRALVEAGAMGKPVVATAHGGAMETIIEGETGLLVAPGDARAQAEAITRIARMSEAQREAMGENGCSRAKAIYSSEAMCEATLRVYHEAMMNRR